MSKLIVHDSNRCCADLAKLPKPTKEAREAIANAIACMNHLQNVVGRQRRQLADIESKRDDF